MPSRAHPGRPPPKKSARRASDGSSRRATRRAARRDPAQLATRFVSEIYAALIGGDWQAFLDGLSDALPNGKTTLFYHDLAAGAGAFSLHSQFDPASTAAYNQYFGSRNPWMARIPVRPIGLGARAERMLPHEKLLRTEFYSDFLRPQGLETGVGVTIMRDQGRSFMLSTLHAKAEDDEAEMMASVLGTLAPHLRQAFTYYRHAAATAGVSTIVAAASDALRVGIVAVGSGRRICWTNALGRELLARGNPIGLDVRGRFTALRAEVREAFDAALDHAMRSDAGRTTSLMLPGRANHRLPMRLTIMVPTMTAFERYFAGPTVLILVEDETRAATATGEALQHAFGLTSSEARLAMAIATGAALADAAEMQGITRETARTHLKRLFAKMGVHRQAELVRRIHELGFRSG